jgi:hypothetical protein
MRYSAILLLLILMVEPAYAQYAAISDSGAGSRPISIERPVRWSGVHFREKDKWQLNAVDSSLMTGLQPAATWLMAGLDSLQGIQDLAVSIDRFRSLTANYDALKLAAIHPRVLAALLPDAWFASAISLAGKWRLVNLSLYFISEAEKVHPNGIYGPNKNCKHP